MDADVARLLAYLGEGPLTRHNLAGWLQMSDRKMRSTVEEARRRGHLVVWHSGNYRLAESADEFNDWARKEVQSRIGTLAIQLRAMRTSRDRRWPAEQMRLIA